MKSLSMLSLLAFALAGAVHAHQDHPTPPGADGKAAPPVAPLAKPKRDPLVYFTDRELLTQDGRKVRFYSDVLKGRTVVIGTIYTHCEDACPLILAQLNQVRLKLGESFGKDVFFVTISSDPVRDTPQAMKKYAAKHSADVPGWIYLTGRKTDIDFILKRLGQWSENVESHSTQLIAWNFNADRGRKMMANVPPEMLAANIMLLNGADGGIPLPSIPAAREQSGK